MIVIAQNGKEINVEDWLAQMRENRLAGRDILEATPIGKTADGEYFWWDEEENLSLTKLSVKNLIQTIKKEAR